MARNFPMVGARSQLPTHLANSIGLRQNLRPHVPVDLPSPLEAARQAGLDRDPSPQLVLSGSYADAIPGFYRITPADYQDEAAQIFMEGYQKTSFLAHHGKSVNILLMVPSSTDKPVMGKAILVAPGSKPKDKLVLDIKATSSSESPVLPTRMTWEVNTSGSTGLFTGAKGQGVLILNYKFDVKNYNYTTTEMGKTKVQVPATLPQRGNVGFFFSGLVDLSPLPGLVQDTETIID